MNRALEINSIERRINAREETVVQLKKRALDCAGETVKEAMLQGADLIKAKHAVGHGQFLAWLSVHCPTISERSARSYMRLASNPQRIADFIAAGSLRQALSLLEEPSCAEQAKTKQWPPYLEAIGRLSKLVGYVQRFPVEQWPDEGLDKFREDLQPIAAKLWPDKFR